ncbi:MAG TPA: flagellar hook-associated protein FlgL [Syntrophorhabdales bacterium]|nr:flagellar hook-associated protein FlgL [Syntrophorhabdales bacterium]
MRVTSKLVFDQMKSNLQSAISGINKIQGEISSGKKIERPSDDPVIYTRATLVDAQKSSDTQLNRNLSSIKTLGTMYENTFNNVNDLLTQAKQLALTYADDTVSPADRQTGAQAVENIIEQLVTLGNTKLNNTYIFGGTKANQPPFGLNPDYSVDYNVRLGARQPVNTYVDEGEVDTTGFSGQELFYDQSKALYENPANSYRGGTFSDSSYFAFVIDAKNNTLYLNGSPVVLDNGTYRGSELAGEIQSKLGPGYYVTYDSASGRFAIQNQTGQPVTFNWSDGRSTAAKTLGYDRLDSTVSNGDSDVSDVEAGGGSILVKVTQNGSTTGPLQERARYRYSLDGGQTWSAEEMIANYGRATTAAEFVVDSSNNTVYENGSPVNLTAGTYTGAALATEIATRLNALQAGHTVTYDPATMKFTITNGTGSTINLNWSNPLATAGSLLGFNAQDQGLVTGVSTTSDVQAGLSMGAIMQVGYQVDPSTDQLVVNDGVSDHTITLNAGVYGGAGLATEVQTELNNTLGAGAFAVSFDGVTNKFTVQNTSGGTTYTLKWSSGSTTAGALLGFGTTDSVVAPGGSAVSDVATDPRNTIYENGAPVTLDAGTYTASGLAAEIQAKLGAGFQASYDETSRQFSITNNSGVPVIFNWSNPSTTLGAMLGFDNRDSTVANGESARSTFDAGMMINGTNGADSINNRLKIAFGSSGSLISGDNFVIKDLDIFGFLKNLKESLENNNTTGIKSAIQDMDLSLDVLNKDITKVGMFNSKVETLTQQNTNRDYLYTTMMSPMTDADITQLTTDLTSLMNSYQALLYSMAKIQNLSIMDYLR